MPRLDGSSVSQTSMSPTMPGTGITSASEPTSTTRSTERRGDALAWEREQQQLILMGDFVSPSAGRISVADLAAGYSRSVRGRSRSEHESPTRAHSASTSSRRSASGPRDR